MDKIWIYVWKQRKLGEIVNRITRKNSKLISELPLTISAQQGLIDQNEFFDKRVASKDVSGYYLIKNGEFAYNKSTSNDAPWGAIKRLDRYENGVLSTLYIVFEIKDETLVNSDFLVAYYSTNLWHKGIHEIAAEGARNHGLLNIAPTDFFKTKLKLPADIEEQKEIGEYFKKIDLLITFHHRKLNILNKIYRYAWEQRKLGELGTVQTCKRIFKEQTSEQGDIPFFKNGTIGLEPDSYISREVYEEFRRLYPYPEVGDTLISVVGSIGRTAEYTGKDEYFQDSNVVWLKTDGSINKKFLKISYQVIKWLIEGSTVKHLYNDNILRSEIVMPVSQIEQAKIAEFFEELAQLITLHQQKCKQLQIIRKFMLKNMFL